MVLLLEKVSLQLEIQESHSAKSYVLFLSMPLLPLQKEKCFVENDHRRGTSFPIFVFFFYSKA